MTSDPDVVVDVRDVCKDFPVGMGFRKKRVLDGISFQVRKGEIFGFVGPNGAGKTTTLKILMGLIRPTEGGAQILGHDVSETGFREHIGFLPENPYFYDYLTGREFLRFYAELCGVPRGERRGRIATLLEWVGLENAGDARLRTYSKGMLQRIGLAQALVHDPEVVFLDEPMSGLDPMGRVEIRDLILRLRADGKTVFMNTHILPDVEMVCDRVAIIVKGKIRYEGQIETFLKSGEERPTQVVLARVPVELAPKIEEDFESEVRGFQDRIEVRVAEKDVGALLWLALGAGADVISVTPQRASLESIFLNAVEEVGQ